MKLNISPSNLFEALDSANTAGIPHWFVERSCSHAARTFEWQRDGNPSGFEITLKADGTWTTTVEYSL
jgi:hypothetical protein